MGYPRAPIHTPVWEAGSPLRLLVHCLFLHQCLDTGHQTLLYSPQGLQQCPSGQSRQSSHLMGYSGTPGECTRLWDSSVGLTVVREEGKVDYAAQTC